MAAKDLGPLDWRVPIVDGNGLPSPEFQRRWQQQRVNNGLIGFVTVSDGVPEGTPQAGQEYVDSSSLPWRDFVADGNGTWTQVGVGNFTQLKDVPGNYTSAADKLLRVNGNATGVEFTTTSAALDALGNATGDLLVRGNSTWAGATLSAVLDAITTTRGSILYRGASGWQALAPGNATQVLGTGGPGADPSWVAQSGGGGGGGAPNTAGLDGLNPGAGTNFSSGYWVGRAIRLQAGSSYSSVRLFAVSAAPTTKLTPAVYAVTGATVGALLASGPTVTGPVQGENALPLSAPLVSTSDRWVWAGFINLGADLVMATSGSPEGALWNNGGTSTPPNPAPSASFTNAGYTSMWLGP